MVGTGKEHERSVCFLVDVLMMVGWVVVEVDGEVEWQ